MKILYHRFKHHHYFQTFVSGIINGKGRYNCSMIDQPLLTLNITSEEQNELGDQLVCTPNHPYERFTVDYNKFYLLSGTNFSCQNVNCYERDVLNCFLLWSLKGGKTMGIIS